MKLLGRVDLKMGNISCPLRIIRKIPIRKIIPHLRMDNAGNANDAYNANNAGKYSFHIPYFPV
jgi:hypothetical protein